MKALSDLPLVEPNRQIVPRLVRRDELREKTKMFNRYREELRRLKFVDPDQFDIFREEWEVCFFFL